MRTVLVGLLALSVVGAWIPTIPYLNLGQLVLECLGPWVVILAATAGVPSMRRWRRDRRLRDLVVGCTAMLATVGSAVVVAAQLAAIHASGIGVSLVRSLYLGPMPHRSPAPEIQTYGQDGDQTLPLAIYRPAAGRGSRPAPVLIYVHGGGWISGNYRIRDSDMRWFADRGILGVSVEYTLSDRNRHLWNVTQGQIGCALAWVEANIARYGGDPARVAMIGESAGGNLVINVAYMANGGTLRPDCPGRLPHIAAVMSLYPVIDVADFYRANGDAYTATAREMAGAYTGGTPEQFPERYASVSSAAHIGPASPATTLIVGASDGLVPPSPAYAFARQASDAGVRMQVIRVPFAGHAFDFLSGSISNQLVRGATLNLLSSQGVAP